MQRFDCLWRCTPQAPCPSTPRALCTFRWAPATHGRTGALRAGSASAAAFPSQEAHPFLSPPSALQFNTGCDRAKIFVTFDVPA